jgi:hypothetical protein
MRVEQAMDFQTIMKMPIEYRGRSIEPTSVEGGWKVRYSDGRFSPQVDTYLQQVFATFAAGVDAAKRSIDEEEQNDER